MRLVESIESNRIESNSKADAEKLRRTAYRSCSFVFVCSFVGRQCERAEQSWLKTRKNRSKRKRNRSRNKDMPESESRVREGKRHDSASAHARSVSEHNASAFYFVVQNSHCSHYTSNSDTSNTQAHRETLTLIGRPRISGLLSWANRYTDTDTAFCLTKCSQPMPTVK